MIKINNNWICKSGLIRMSDPCYPKDMDLNLKICGLIDNADKGEWCSQVNIITKNNSSEKVSKLLTYHQNFDINSDNLCWKKLDFKVGADSGQVGFFDDNAYPKYYGSCGNTKFYDVCSNITLKSEAGIVNYLNENIGVISTSGWGDGCYDCYSIVKDDKTVALYIEFINDQNEQYIF